MVRCLCGAPSLLIVVCRTTCWHIGCNMVLQIVGEQCRDVVTSLTTIGLQLQLHFVSNKARCCFCVLTTNQHTRPQNFAFVCAGEAMPEGIDAFLRHIPMDKSSVFVDLGSGLGRLVLQVACSCSIKQAIGIELSSTRQDQVRGWVGLPGASQCRVSIT